MIEMAMLSESKETHNKVRPLVRRKLEISHFGLI
jgi:hypothetical protein